MKKYRTAFCSIEEIEIIDEKEKYVVLESGKRESKVSDRICWHDSFEDAKKHLIDAAQKDIDNISSRLDYSKERLEKINNLKEVVK
jgi:hypothetical protein